MALTQPMILKIIVFCDLVAIGVFISALIFPWYKQSDPEEGEPADLTLFDCLTVKSNGMFVLGCIGAMIGGTIAALTSILIHFFGDICIAAVGMEWFAGFIKGMMMRVCNTTVMSCAGMGLVFGFQIREKGESLALGWFMNLICGPFGMVATCMIYYLPFAPTGEKGIFDEEDGDEEDGGGGGDDKDDGGGDDDSDSDKKKSGGGGWFGGGGGSDDEDSDSDDSGKKGK